MGRKSIRVINAFLNIVMGIQINISEKKTVLQKLVCCEPSVKKTEILTPRITIRVKVRSVCFLWNCDSKGRLGPQ